MADFVYAGDAGAFKTCTSCYRCLSSSSFSKQRLGVFGVTSRCRECEKAYKSEFYLKNKDRIDARNKAYSAQNPDVIAAASRAHYERNRGVWAQKNSEVARRELGKSARTRPRLCGASASDRQGRH